MENFDDIDPLDAAFANPKAGKKLKPGEQLPGMERASTMDYDAPIQVDAALSKTLDEAFHESRFEVPPPPAPTVSSGIPESEAALAAAAEEKLARSLDDAFANPKAGEKIQSQPSPGGIAPEALGLTGIKADLRYDESAPPKAGFFSPKVLVIGMLLAVVVIGFIVGGSGDQKPAKPNVIRLTG